MNIQERIRKALSERNAGKQILAEAQKQATKDLARVATVSNAVVDVLQKLELKNDFSTTFHGGCEVVDLAGKVLPDVPIGSYQSMMDAIMRNGEQGRSCIKTVSSIFYGDGWSNDYVVSFTKGADDNMECRLRILDIEHMGYSAAEEYWSVRVDQTIELGSDMTPESDVPEMLLKAMNQVVEAKMESKQTNASPYINF